MFSAKAETLQTDPAPRAGLGDAKASRRAILVAARKRFASSGYENTKLRDIAADAGIDVALVAKYFGSKEALFLTVLEAGYHPDVLFGGDRSQFGSRIAAMLVSDGSDYQYELESLMLAVGAAASPTALALVRRFSHDRFLAPFAKWLGGRDALLRAHMIFAVISGGIVERTVSSDPPLRPPMRNRYRKHLADLLQSYIDPL